MDALTLHKKKNTISKGKLKKSIKNVICRPDPVFWPEITEEQALKLQMILNQHKVKIPEYKKPHWKELQSIPKESRPKPPKIKKVDGLLFGITECSNAIQNDQCAAIILESTVNPRMIVEPIIQLCILREIPILCIKELRKLTLVNFGIKTSCLGLKCECLLDVQNEIMALSKLYPYPKPKSNSASNNNIEKMNIEENKEFKSTIIKTEISESPYLYRTNKKARVFVPVSQEISQKPKELIGQYLVDISDKVEQDSKSYMKMILKRICNNPDRVKNK